MFANKEIRKNEMWKNSYRDYFDAIANHLLGGLDQAQRSDHGMNSSSTLSVIVKDQKHTSAFNSFNFKRITSPHQRFSRLLNFGEKVINLMCFQPFLASSCKTKVLASENQLKIPHSTFLTPQEEFSEAEVFLLFLKSSFEE